MLKKIIKSNLLVLLFTYFLFIFENILIIYYPKVLGEAIDYLIDNEYKYLWYLCIVLTLSIIVGFARRIYDTYVFSNIYEKLVKTIVLKQKAEGVPTSKISARSALSRGIITFLETDMIVIIYALFSVIGSVYFLININGKVGLLTICFIVPILLISIIFSKKIKKFTKRNNDLIENEVDVIEKGVDNTVNKYYFLQKMYSIKLSNLNAFNSVFVDTLIYCLIIVGVVVYIKTSGELSGKVLSMYQYLIRFSSGVLQIPYFVISIVRVKDILNRIKE